MKRKSTPLPKPERDYIQVLQDFTTMIFEHMATREDISWFDLLKQANVSTSTFYNLMHRKTLRPQFYTLYKLAKCAGLSFRLIEKQERKILQISKRRRAA